MGTKQMGLVFVAFFTGIFLHDNANQNNRYKGLLEV